MICALFSCILDLRNGECIVVSFLLLCVVGGSLLDRPCMIRE